MSYPVGGPAAVWAVGVDVSKSDAHAYFTWLETQLNNGVIRGTPGKQYHLLTATIDSTPDGFVLLDDAGHAPTGFTGVVENVDGTLRLEHDLGAGKVSHLHITCDEKYAKYGIIPGYSVGRDFSEVTLEAPLSFTVNCDTGAVVSPFWGDLITADIDDGKITVTHPATLSDRDSMSITQRDAPRAMYPPSLTHTATTVEIAFLMDMFGYCDFVGPTDADWVFSGTNFTGLTGLFSGGVGTFNHPPAQQSDLQLTARHPVLMSGFAGGATSFQVAFYRPGSAGAIAAAHTDMGFWFRRGGVNPIVGSTVHAPLGAWDLRGAPARINADKLRLDGANFFVSGLLEV